MLDDDFDRDVLGHVTILKLAEEEARAIVGDAELESLASLGVPEVVVTFGLEGSLVLTREGATRVPARGGGTSTRPAPATRSPSRTWRPAPPVTRRCRPRGARPRSSPRC